MNRIAVRAVRKKNTDLGKRISKHVNTYIFNITVETEMLLQGNAEEPYRSLKIIFQRIMITRLSINTLTLEEKLVVASLV